VRMRVRTHAVCCCSFLPSFLPSLRACARPRVQLCVHTCAWHVVARVCMCGCARMHVCACMCVIAGASVRVRAHVQAPTGCAAEVVCVDMCGVPCVRRYSLNGQGTDWVAPRRNMTSFSDNIFNETAFNNSKVASDGRVGMRGQGPPPLWLNRLGQCVGHACTCV
jgi:hypothetical protein